MDEFYIEFFIGSRSMPYPPIHFVQSRTLNTEQLNSSIKWQFILECKLATSYMRGSALLVTGKVRDQLVL
jgi:hypothetical protein